MISRIYVTPKNKGQNGRPHVIQAFLLEHKFGNNSLQKIARVLTNPALEDFSINKLKKHSGYSTAIEIGFRPGVTDNVAHTVEETVVDLLGGKVGKFEVYSSKVFLLKSKKQNVAQEFAASLYNPLIEHANIVHEKNGEYCLPLEVPKVVLEKREPVIEVPLDLTEDELVKLGREGIMDPDGSPARNGSRSDSGRRRGPLALDLDSLNVIRDYFKKLKRNPTDIELESLAQTWSEHCKHTIFANPIDDITDGLYKTYIKGATNLIRKQKGKNDFCVSVFSDNAGGIIFDNDYLVTHKVETHNSPSALDPFGGAITGIVGVNRDTIGFGLGAKPVANMYGFCLAEPEDERKFFRDRNLTEEMLGPARIMEGVIKGINVGGNCSGIPTPTGFVKFDERYRAKPLVFAGTVGLIPRKIKGKSSHVKKAKPGDHIVMVGGRVGLDGIHGATFSSVATDSNSPASAVQIGDPITQKKLSDVIVKEARDLGLYNSITDNGAGGLSCSVAEMARECGGAEVNLEKVPLKYPGLRPWEIWISESQERMTLAVPSKNWKKFKELMESRGVEATVIGKFTSSGKCVVKYNNKKIMDLDMEFLHNGLPKHKLMTTPTSNVNNEPDLKEKKSFTQDLEKLLGEKNIAGHSFISEQYDHEVQASSVLKPLSGRGRINTDAQVLKPVLDSEKGAVLSSATYPSYGDISTYDMAAAAIDTAVRNTIAAGGKLSHLALLDNFCWCSSNDPVRLGQLVDAVKACHDYAVGYGTPFISGKDSMFNDFKGYDEKGNLVSLSIPPTLLISSIGVMPDLKKTVSPEFKNAGDVIYLLGETNNELGGGEYLKMLARSSGGLGSVGNKVPKVNLEKNLKTYRTLELAIEKELLNSAISVNSGGLAIALAKASVGGMLGCNISVKNLPGNTSSVQAKLFSESQGRILVSVSPKNVSKFEKITAHIPKVRLGRILGTNKFIITDDKKVVDTSVKNLYKIYHSFSESMK